jgi:hypothetical protein
VKHVTLHVGLNLLRILVRPVVNVLGIYCLLNMSDTLQIVVVGMPKIWTVTCIFLILRPL